MGIGRAIGTVVGTIGGFMLGGPQGAVAGATIGNQIGRGIGGGRRYKPPPITMQQAQPMTRTPPLQRLANREAREAEPVAPQLPPVNFLQIMDDISGEQMTFTRGTDGKQYIVFKDTRNRVPLDAPIERRAVNTSLPEVRRLQGRSVANLDIQEAAVVAALSQEMRSLMTNIATVEQTNPLWVEQNRPFLDQFRQAQKKALEKGFDIRQNALDTKLTRMGLMKSSSAIGAQILLTREKAEAASNASLQHMQLAQNLKQQTIENMQQRGQGIMQTAGVELQRYGTENASRLEARGQDIALRAQDFASDLNTQQLEQQRAIAGAELQLRDNQQGIEAELGRRNLQLGLMANRRLGMLGISQINNNNNNAVAAYSADNQAANALQQSQLHLAQMQQQGALQLNTLQQNRFALEQLGNRNPWRELGQDLTGNYLAQQLGLPLPQGTNNNNAST